MCCYTGYETAQERDFYKGKLIISIELMGYKLVTALSDLRGVSVINTESIGVAELSTEGVCISFLHVAHWAPIIVDVDLSKT